MLLLDAFFRFSGIGMMLMVIVMAVRDLPRSVSFYLLILTNACLISHFLAFTPSIFSLAHPAHTILRIIDVLILPSVWLFSLSLFQKDFRLKLVHVLGALSVAGVMMAERFVYFGWLAGLPKWWPLLVNTLAFGMVFHLILVTLIGRNDDLLEKRRKTRLYLILVIAISASLTILFGSIFLGRYQATINVISLWPAIVATCLWLVNIEPQTFAFKAAKPTPVKKPSSQYLQLQQDLETAMNNDHIYLEPQLTVNKLARHIGVSATQLRGFINQHLGHSNFSSYINGYRIEAIKMAMRLPENNHLPILTLALNNGFNSLPPFNRAFKKQVAMTPTEYRKKAQK